jgi:hypothetical protein
VVLVEAIDRTGRLEPMYMLTLVVNPILKAGVPIITLDVDTTYSNESVHTAQMFLLVAKIQTAHGCSTALSTRTPAYFLSGVSNRTLKGDSRLAAGRASAYPRAIAVTP